MSAQMTESRRRFLQGMGLGVFTLAVGGGRIIQAAEAGDLPEGFAPNAFIRVGPTGPITVISAYLEMGQGTFTGLATLAAEELDVPLSAVEVVPAEADARRYANPELAKAGFAVQGTGGSTAMAGAWDIMRKAAATARAMLLSAAGRTWSVPTAELEVEQGVIVHAASGRRAPYGQFVNVAATLPVPKGAPVKARDAFRIIGHEGVVRVDAAAKVDGSAIYTQDVKLPGMLVAVVAYPPRRWSRVRHVDASAALKIPGVAAVVELPGDNDVQGGVAVLSRNTWTARQGRDALVIDWDTDDALDVDTDRLFERFRTLSSTPGPVAVHRGSAIGQVPDGGRSFEGVYEQPYLSHSPMEPMNCLIRMNADGCEMWNGEQWHTADQAAVAAELGLKPAQVRIHQVYAGGSFGRRANPRSDYVRATARILKAARAQGVDAPIKLVWMREDDTHALQYRPMTVHRVHAATDAKGALVSWDHTVVGQSFFKRSSPTAIDSSLVEGASDGHYAIPNYRVQQQIPDDVAVPVAWLRSVGHTHSAFVVETMMDEIATSTGQDPYVFRRALLGNATRLAAVLDKVVAMAGWNRPLAPGAAGARRGRGLAVHESFGTYVAQVAEVTVHDDETFSVDRVFCAVDCGTVINPDMVRAQMEGGIAFGLGFLLQGISFSGGRVQQGNFNDYPVLRLNAMPEVHVEAIASSVAPMGVGEPGVPPVAPAVVNALAAITGQRHRRLPLSPVLRMV